MYFKNPRVVLGGMGTGVSHAPLVRAAIRVATWGEVLGVVSGIVQLPIKARQLQKSGGYRDAILRALETFPNQEIAQEFKRRYYIKAGKPEGEPFRPNPVFDVSSDQSTEFTASDFNVLAVYLEVAVAKEGHTRPVGINLMQHLQVPLVSSLYGAMLAGIDWVLIGAGIPNQVASILNDLAENKPIQYRLSVIGAEKDDNFVLEFDPTRIVGPNFPVLKRPRFMPIISFEVLAKMLIKGASMGGINGFVVEGPTAGGHNANPRSKPIQYNRRGEPIYTDRDKPDLQELARICKQQGIPFYLAGGYASPEAYQLAREVGATGVQVGSIFALSAESGLEPEIRKFFIEQALRGKFDNFTDPLASPSGFAFKVARMPGSISDKDIYVLRTRICDLGYLRDLFRKENSSIGYRCPAEDISAFLAKGGTPEETVGRVCLCNCLLANIGLGQIRSSGYREPFGVTLGDDLSFVPRILNITGRTDYTAAEAVNFILGRLA